MFSASKSENGQYSLLSDQENNQNSDNRDERSALATKARLIRREWRTLNKAEKKAYVDAAPSAHDAAPFLPWHRYFIYSYEQALKEHCGYRGILPYWDWSKDYQNVLESPIWDDTLGFGTNGDIGGPEGGFKGALRQ
ncbi:tyrosinase-like protein [Penicillium herquei]|nr:tyrosinase-like protein [Penicillium herquei]